jgi:hypothetical protein
MYFKISGCTVRLSVPKSYRPATEYFRSVVSDFGVTKAVRSEFDIVYKGTIEKPAAWPQPSFRGLAIRNEEGGCRTLIYSRSALCRILWRQKAAEIFLLANAEKPELLLVDFIKIVVSALAVEKGGLPLHSSAVFKKNGGLVFFGPSGAGKSTIAGLLAPAWGLLNDEFNILLPVNGVYRVYSTPFSAPQNYHLCSNGSAAVLGLFMLEKGASNRTSDVSFREQCLALACSVYALPLNDRLCQKMLENVGAVCREMSVRKLTFVNDASVVRDMPSFLRKNACRLK